MKKLYLVLGILLGAFITVSSVTQAAFVPISVPAGGTGSTTAVTGLGGILAGNGTAAIKSVVIGSNLTWDGTTLSATGGGGTPGGTSGQLQYNATGAFAGVASTTLAGSGVISISNSPVVIGASPAVATIVGGANGQVLGWLSGVPTWTATSSVAAGTGISVSTAGSVNTVSLTNTTISGVALGGTLAALTALDTTLTFSGSYTGATARTVGLNLGNANTWTALQQFNGAASSTLFSANQAQFGATATTTFGTDGKITGNDVANGFFGRISPTHEFLLPYATTTTLTGTSSATDISQMSSIDMDYSGIPRSVSCVSDGFPGIEVDKNGSPLSPSYFIASSTRGTITFTGSPTFVKGDVFSIKTGTTTTDTGFHYARCNVLITETP